MNSFEKMDFQITPYYVYVGHLSRHYDDSTLLTIL
jgi:hypothetical protein